MRLGRLDIFYKLPALPIKYGRWYSFRIWLLNVNFNIRLGDNLYWGFVILGLVFRLRIK